MKIHNEFDYIIIHCFCEEKIYKKLRIKIYKKLRIMYKKGPKTG